MAKESVGKRQVSWPSKWFCTYFALGAALPVAAFKAGGPLPFVHNVDFDGRVLWATVIGLFLLMLEFRNIPKTTPVGQFSRGTVLVFVTGVAILGSADNSATIFGALSHVLPSTPYQENTEVEHAWFKQYKVGSRNKNHEWVRLELRSKESGKLLYVDLPTRILSEHWPIATATIRLEGWQTLLGPYVTHATYEFHSEYEVQTE